MLIGTGDQLVVIVEVQTVGTFGSLQPEGDALLLIPAVDAVVGLVGEVDAAVFGDSRAFGEGVAGFDLLNYCVLRYNGALLSVQRSCEQHKCKGEGWFHMFIFSYDCHAERVKME